MTVLAFFFRSLCFEYNWMEINIYWQLQVCWHTVYLDRGKKIYSPTHSVTYYRVHRHDVCTSRRDRPTKRFFPPQMYYIFILGGYSNRAWHQSSSWHPKPTTGPCCRFFEKHREQLGAKQCLPVWLRPWGPSKHSRKRSG